MRNNASLDQTTVNISHFHLFDLLIAFILLCVLLLTFTPKDVGQYTIVQQSKVQSSTDLNLYLEHGL